MTNPRKASAEDLELVRLFSGLDTPGVSDAMDKLGLHGQALGIMPLADYASPVVGPAYTVKYVPASVPAGTVGDFIDDVAQGDIIVLDNDGRTDCTVWGDIMTHAFSCCTRCHSSSTCVRTSSNGRACAALCSSTRTRWKP